MNKNWQKTIKSLHQKKYRKQEGLFIVEGVKSVREALASHFESVAFFFAPECPSDLVEFGIKRSGFSQATDAQTLAATGTFVANDGALAVFKTKEAQWDMRAPGLVLALDDIRDPGNMGTIVRIADWYKIDRIFCSETCVDFFNPKTIAASMGSFTRASARYGDLQSFLRGAVGFQAWGACMDGQNIHEITESPARLILVIGNESNGIQPATEILLTKKVAVPRFGGAESLNAGIATAILCDNLKRLG